MCDRARQFDVTHALTTNLSQGDFNATLFTDDAAVLQALVLTAQALVVLNGAENTRTEQTIALGFESTVVNGFGLLHFAKRPATNFFGAGQADANGVELVCRALLAQQIH